MFQDSKYIISWMGSKIRDMRISKNWSLTDLAHRSGISIAILSKIENGRMFPTFPRLIQILKTLDVDLNAFFEDVNETVDFPGYIVIKKEDYKKTEKEDSTGFNYQNIINRNINDVSMEISLLTLSKQAKRDPVITEGFEFIYLVKGTIDFKLDYEIIRLDEGDSIYFDGRIPHVPMNRSDNESVLFLIYLIANT